MPATNRVQVQDWLKLARAVSSQVSIRGWEKTCLDPFTAAAGAHDAIEVALIETGTVSYRIGAREIVASAGQIVVVPRGAVHQTSFLTPTRAIALWLGADFVREVADAMGPEIANVALTAGVLERKTARAQSLVSILVDEVNDGAEGSTRAAEALTESIVIEVLRKAPRDGVRRGRDPGVAQAIAQMHASFAEPLSIDDLAKTARMSRFHFSRLFRDEMGQAPYQYLLRVRLARASELLRGGHHSVTEAAIEAGFSDLSRFASMFKKHVGKRPSDLLRQARSA